MASDLYEYLFILSPDQELQDSILAIKRYFGSKYKSDHALNSLGHISLLKIVLPKDRLSLLSDSTAVFGKNQAPFQVYLKDYGFFPPQTVYLNIIKNENISRLQQKLAITILQKMKIPPSNIKIVKEHHLTIARKLQPEQFYSAEEEFKYKQFEGNFVAKNIVMLYRPLDKENGYRWLGNINHYFSSPNI